MLSGVESVGQRRRVRREGTVRIIVVEADEIENAGTVAALRTEGLDVVGVSPNPGDIWLDDRWSATDTVIAGLGGCGDGWDRFSLVDQLDELTRNHPGLRVVGLLRSPLNPVVSLRLHLAGVSEIYDGASRRSAAALRDLALVTSSRAAPSPDYRELARLGIGRRCDPARALALVATPELRRALDTNLSQRATGLSRRAVERIRRVVSAAADLRPCPSSSTGGAHRDLSLPTWRQVIDFVEMARGATDTSGRIPSHRASHDLT